MKAFTFIGYVLIITLAVENVKAFTDAEKKAVANKMIGMGLQCAGRHPLTLSDLKAFQKKTMPDGNKPKCFVACMFKKVGVMDSKGMMSPAGAHKYGEELFKGNEEYLKNIDEIMKVCSAVNEQSTDDGEKGCDRAKLAFPCFIENGPKYGFDF